MPLSIPTTRRELKHTRAITVQAYVREDGLWDIDARITDTKTFDHSLATGIRPAGQPVHDLWLRTTINRELTIVDAEAVSDAVPYPGYCEAIAPDYKKLIGLSLVKGFRPALKEILSGTAGCTHLTELAQVLPTAAIQAFAGVVNRSREPDQSHKPFQLDRCHALHSGGLAVAKYYPRWFEPPSG